MIFLLLLVGKSCTLSTPRWLIWLRYLSKVHLWISSNKRKTLQTPRPGVRCAMHYWQPQLLLSHTMTSHSLPPLHTQPTLTLTSKLSQVRCNKINSFNFHKLFLFFNPPSLNFSHSSVDDTKLLKSRLPFDGILQEQHSRSVQYPYNRFPGTNKLAQISNILENIGTWF